LVAALLLAADFPAENPRTQNRNVPYTKTLTLIRQRSFKIGILSKKQEIYAGTECKNSLEI